MYYVLISVFTFNISGGNGIFSLYLMKWVTSCKNRPLIPVIIIQKKKSPPFKNAFFKFAFGHGLFDLLTVTFEGQTFFTEYGKLVGILWSCRENFMLYMYSM